MGHIKEDIIQTSLYGRVSKLLESYEWSDCSFSVAGKNFKAHKLILGISSPVFKAMFYGPLASSDDIIIPDIEPDTFQLLLNYIYTDKVDISSVEHALELLYAAKKYLLEHLTEKCIDYIVGNMSVDNVIAILNFSEYVQETRLVTLSLKLFCERAEFIFSEYLSDISASCLKIILGSNQLNMPELSLIKIVFLWTKYNCENSNVTETLENRRKILIDNNMMKLLRFTTLSLEELEDISSNDNNILLPSEVSNLKTYASNDKDDTKGLDEKSMTLYPMKPRDSMKLIWFLCHRNSLGSAAPLLIDAHNNKVHVRVMAEKTVFVNSLSVPTRMSPILNFRNDHPMHYAEQFSVSVVCESDKSEIKLTNFMNTVEYDSNIFVEFSKPCVLKKKKWYKITFEWPQNHSYGYYYIVSYRQSMSYYKAVFHFNDLFASRYSDGSFLESLKFSL